MAMAEEIMGKWGKLGEKERKRVFAFARALTRKGEAPRELEPIPKEEEMVREMGRILGEAGEEEVRIIGRFLDGIEEVMGRKGIDKGAKS